MDDIKKSRLVLLSIKEDDRILTKFAMGKFQEKYPISFTNHIWYNGYEVIDENTIRVKYQYGGGDLEIDGHFDVKIDE